MLTTGELFFPYFGGKFRRSKLYPRPQHATVIEPFCGGAGFATKYRHRNVILSDTNPVVVATWDYLIHARSSEIRRLPAAIQDLDDYPKLIPEQRYLIGWWLFRGCVHPRRRLSSWQPLRSPGSYWCATVRDRLAVQVNEIRHWKVSCHGYDRCPPWIGTWYVDPPYTEMGKHYTNKFDEYQDLAEWCGRRRGQVIVCERKGADWMDFRPLPGDDAEVYFHRPQTPANAPILSRTTSLVTWSHPN